MRTEGIAAPLESLTENEFAYQESNRGRRLHQHDGVWWVTRSGVFSRPAFEFRQIVPGEARPSPLRRLVGYSHQVPDREMATRWLDFMTIEKADLAGFGMTTLRSEKRAQVRKGLRECQVREIHDLPASLPEMKAINISQATRQMGTGRFDRPPAYYENQEAAWRASLAECHGLKGWRWLGAYADDKLVAYLVLLAVERHAFFMAVKSHSDFLRRCPNDALYFTALTDLRETGWCVRVVNGSSAHASLNQFKEQFGFRSVAVPYYTPHAVAFSAARRLLSRADALRRRMTAALDGKRGTPLRIVSGTGVGQ